MIFIVVKFTIRPEHSEHWLMRVEEFTKATQAEEGNIFFEWSRSVDVPHQFVLCEAFRDAAAGGEHVNSEHFKTAIAWMPEVVASTPQIVNVEVPQDGWGEMGEVAPRG